MTTFYIPSYSQFAEEAFLKTLWGKKPYSSKPAGTEEKLFKKSIDCQQKIEVIEDKFKFS